MPRSTLGGSDGGPDDPRGRVGGKREKRNKTKCLLEPLGRITPRRGAFAYIRILYKAHVYIYIFIVYIEKRNADGDEDRRAVSDRVENIRRSA